MRPFFSFLLVLLFVTQGNSSAEAAKKRTLKKKPARASIKKIEEKEKPVAKKNPEKKKRLAPYPLIEVAPVDDSVPTFGSSPSSYLATCLLDQPFSVLDKDQKNLPLNKVLSKPVSAVFIECTSVVRPYSVYTKISSGRFEPFRAEVVCPSTGSKRRGFVEIDTFAYTLDRERVIGLVCKDLGSK